jgi:hypothetical protein
MQHDTECNRVKSEIIMRSFNENLEVSLCCKARSPVVFNSFEQGHRDLQAIRDSLAAGNRHEHCIMCWHNEKRGIPSWREIGNRHEPVHYTAELYIDNTCDMACVYCGPQYSSKWQQTIKSSNEEDKRVLYQTLNEPQFRSNINGPDVKENHKQMIYEQCRVMGREANTNNLRYQIVFLGGETLLTSSVKEDTISKVVEMFYSEADPEVDLALMLVTNGNTPDHILDMTLSKLDENKEKYPNLSCTVHISIESIGKRAEYIRYGMEWEQFEKNVNKWMASSNEVSVSASMNTVSLPYTGEFMHWLFSTATKHNKTVNPLFNHIVNPRIMSIGMYDKEEFTYVFDEVRQIMADNKHCFKHDDMFQRSMNQLRENEDLLGKYSHDISSFWKLKEYFEWIKRSRGLSIEDVNPIIVDIMNRKISNV